MAVRENTEDALLRWKKLELLQQVYSSFSSFLDDAMQHLGFDTSEVQHDIGAFLEHGPQYLMIQAQRGQAKTTITAIFAVWSLIHSPSFRILILSAGGKQASEISTLIVRLIMTMDVLECLRPDPSNGDRTSVEAFDVHYTLKGVDKSPSVACIGVTGNLQGKRADLLIPDDIESVKNSRTATMRELLLELTRDFTSICETGRIVYLGTPQSQDSIYNTLPARGFTVRIWPGRYPTPEQRENYGDMLAPYIKRKIDQNPALAFGGGMLGDQGQPVDDRLDEAVLQKKELDQGTSYFQLQHMLNTRLADAERYPLKTENLVVMRLGGTQYPMKVVRGFGGSALRPIAVHSSTYHLSMPHEVSSETASLQGVVMYVDPAGGGRNGDETGYAITGFLNGNIYLLAAGGLPGGYSLSVMKRLSALARKWAVNKIIIEQNMGYGAFREVWLPILRADEHEAGVTIPGYKGAVEDDYVTGQKELRIIETLEPVMSRGSLIVNEDVIEEDAATSANHEASKRALYSLFHQLSKMTREKGALFHDDRADALEGAVRYWVKQLAIDQNTAVERQREAEWRRAISDPMNRQRHQAPSFRGTSLLSRYYRT
ncbi:phage terminase large subunit [Sphingomonas sp.]